MHDQSDPTPRLAPQYYDNRHDRRAKAAALRKLRRKQLREYKLREARIARRVADAAK